MTKPHRSSTANPRWKGDEAVAILDEIQHLTDVGFWTYDVSTDEARWSKQAKEIHDFEVEADPSMEQVLGQYIEADQQTLRELLSAAIDESESFEIDGELTEGERRNRFIRLNCRPQVVDGETGTLYGTAMDVTEAKRRAQRIEVLRRTSQQLKRTKSRQDVVEIIADASKNILGLVNTTIRLVDDSADTLETVLATEECVELAGERPDYPVDGDNPASRVYRTGEPEIYSNIQSADDEWDRGELVSGMYVPIGTYGVLSTGFVVSDTFDEHDLEATGLLCQVGADALTRISWVKRSRVV